MATAFPHSELKKQDSFPVLQMQISAHFRSKISPKEGSSSPDFEKIKGAARRSDPVIDDITEQVLTHLQNQFERLSGDQLLDPQLRLGLMLALNTAFQTWNNPAKTDLLTSVDHIDSLVAEFESHLKKSPFTATTRSRAKSRLAHTLMAVAVLMPQMDELDLNITIDQLIEFSRKLPKLLHQGTYISSPAGRYATTKILPSLDYRWADYAAIFISCIVLIVLLIVGIGRSE